MEKSHSLARTVFLYILLVVGVFCLLQFFVESGSFRSGSQEMIKMIYKECDTGSTVAEENQKTTPQSRKQPTPGLSADATRFLTFPFHGIKSGAGLGNQLFEIFALIGIANTTNRLPVVNIDDSGVIQRFLDIMKHFTGLIYQLNFVYKPPEVFTPESIHTKGCCRFSPLDALKAHTEQYVIGHGIYFQSSRYFEHMRAQLLQWMQPTKEARSQAEQVLRRNQTKGHVICVHARRGDFLTAPMPQPSEANFTWAATQYLIEKYGGNGRPTSVVLISNDQPWLKSVFEALVPKGDASNLTPNANYSSWQSDSTTFIQPRSPTPFVDLVIAHDVCDTVLITAPASTFGYFLGFLARNGTGDVYYAEKFSKATDGLEKQIVPWEFMLSHWKPLRFDNETMDIEQFEWNQNSVVNP